MSIKNFGAKRSDCRDLTGLTKAQKKIIKQTWMTNFRKEIKYHSCEIYIRFLTRYPEYVQMFNFTDHKIGNTELMENKAYQAHCITEMMAINNLIEFGLNDPPLYAALSNKMAKSHSRHKMTSRPIENFCLIMLDYILETLQKKRSTKLDVEEAWCVFVKSVFNGFLGVPTV